MSAEPIRLTDIESKLRQIDDDVRGKVTDKRQTLILGAVLTASWCCSWRTCSASVSGKKKSTFIDIRQL